MYNTSYPFRENMKFNKPSIFERLREVQTQKRLFNKCNTSKKKTEKMISRIKKQEHQKTDQITGEYKEFIKLKEELLSTDDEFNHDYVEFNLLCKVIIEEQDNLKRKELNMKNQLEKCKKKALLKQKEQETRQKSANLIQANFRGYIIRKYLKIAKNKKKAARVIWLFWKKFKSISNFKQSVFRKVKKTVAGTKIQRAVKFYMTKKKVQLNYHRAINKVLALILGYKVRKICSQENMVDQRKQIYMKKRELDYAQKNQPDVAEELYNEWSYLMRKFHEFFSKYCYRGWTYCDYLKKSMSRRSPPITSAKNARQSNSFNQFNMGFQRSPMHESNLEVERNLFTSQHADLQVHNSIFLRSGRNSISPARNDETNSQKQTFLSKRASFVDERPIKPMNDLNMYNSAQNEVERPIKPMTNANYYSTVNDQEIFDDSKKRSHLKGQKSIEKSPKKKVDEKTKKRMNLQAKRNKYDPRKAAMIDHSKTKPIVESKVESHDKNDIQNSLKKIKGKSYVMKINNDTLQNHVPQIVESFIEEENDNLDDEPKNKFNFLKRESKKVEFHKLNWTGVKSRVDCWFPKEEAQSIRGSNTYKALSYKLESPIQSPVTQKSKIKLRVPNNLIEHGTPRSRNPRQSSKNNLPPKHCHTKQHNTLQQDANYNSSIITYNQDAANSVKHQRSNRDSQLKDNKGSSSMSKQTRPSYKNQPIKNASKTQSAKKITIIEPKRILEDNTNEKKSPRDSKNFTLTQIKEILNGPYFEKLASTLKIEPKVKTESNQPKMENNSQLLQSYRRDLFNSMVKNLDSEYERLIAP